jgi:hypothetical protein
MALLLIVPIATPVTMAVYSVAGEKPGRSLEPILATWISAEELLAGKALAATAARSVDCAGQPRPHAGNIPGPRVFGGGHGSALGS